jgi:hypothetical protein
MKRVTEPLPDDGPSRSDSAPSSAQDVPSWRQRCGDWLLSREQTLNRWSARPRNRVLLLAASFAVFVILTVLSFAAIRGGVDFHLWAFLVLVFVATPAIALINAAEYRVIARIIGHDVPWAGAIHLTVVASAANLLPLPGGVMVRTQALRQRGSSYKGALGANAAAGMAWVATGCFAIGVLLVGGSDRRIGTGVGLVAIAIAAVVGTLGILRRAERERSLRHLVALLIVEVTTVILTAVRIALAFMMIGFHVDVVQAVALTASIIIAAAVGIFPAGLGLREALAGLIGSAVSLRAARSIAAIAADRVADQIGLAVIAGIVIVLNHRRSARNRRQAGDSDPLLVPVDRS